MYKGIFAWRACVLKRPLGGGGYGAGRLGGVRDNACVAEGGGWATARGFFPPLYAVLGWRCEALSLLVPLRPTEAGRANHEAELRPLLQGYLDPS